jgi:transcription initiation factor TFIIH subunit 4
MWMHYYYSYINHGFTTSSSYRLAWSLYTPKLRPTTTVSVESKWHAAVMSATASQRALDYLEALPGTTFTKLYQQPSTALAIFRRMLPHLAKTIVMAMLYMPAPFATADLDTWIKPDLDSIKARDQATSILSRLRILYEKPAKDGRSAYTLSPQFAKALRLALTGGGSHRSFGVPATERQKPPVSVDYLDTLARRQWEAILYYVVGSANSSLSGEVDVSSGTKALLEKGQFVARQGSRKVTITKQGFEFVLQEINAQVWTFLIVYLEMVPHLQMDPIEVLAFLFTLGSLELGTPYSTSNLTSTQHQMLDDLSDFGLIHRPSPSSTLYYPTRLATTLTSDAPALPNTSLSSANPTVASNTATGSDEKGYIIVETNYRLYAYTQSPLLISILSLFAKLKTRYPNLTTAKLTQRSIKRAIQSGITSDQIISYLTSQAHPVIRHQTPILPPTVVDQIRLWQLQDERMKAHEGFLIKDVGSAEEFEQAVRYAEALGVLKKQFPERGWFFVSRMDQMGTYFKNAAARKKGLTLGGGRPV